MINTDCVKVEIWVWDQLKNHVKNEFSSEVWQQVNVRMCDQVWEKVISQVRYKVWYD